MNILLTGLALLFALVAQAQTLYAGGWRTSSDSPYTRITATNNLEIKTYRIDCSKNEDAIITQFKLLVDGVVIQPTLQEGSYVVVQGKSIAIFQQTAGGLLKGSWVIIQQADIAAITSPWSCYPGLSAEMLIAAFKTEQEVVLSINAQSVGCTSTSFSVYIDGEVIKDETGKILPFLEGSTVYAKGKAISINAYGACARNTPVNGDLKLKKQL